jgi:hypothetical protein
VAFLEERRKYLTLEQQLARMLACALYQLGGSLDVSKELLDNMKPVKILWDTDTDPKLLKLSITSQELLVGSVDKNTVEVIV